MLSSLLIALSITLMYSAPLTLAAIGGVISERSGVVNIGIEGMMSIGALTGAVVGYFSHSAWLGLLCAGLAGGVLALLHAVASISFRADQTVSGIAINLIGPGLAMFLSRYFFDGASITYPVPEKLPKLVNFSYLKGTPFANFNIDVSVVLALAAVVITWFVLYKTKWGLRIRALGEHPAAVDTLGVPVYRSRYACVIMSGILAGIGGGTVTLAIMSNFSPIAISGQGFIALAAVIFGKWKPWGAYAACLLFGFSQTLVIMLGGGAVHVPSTILAMIPYVLTILILIIFVGRSSAPRASGVPYEKGAR
ncbi:MAG: ABC transporter permease [Clostridia bacterium]|nr:ABC transporter permease [Clostridia bacterium]MBR2734812.1 ABC transporter permease [Clostridia bacterium]